MTILRVSHLTIYVKDQAVALNWYRDKLGFVVCMDNDLVVPGQRWLTVAPAGNPDVQFVLMSARSADDESRIGNNLMTVLRTDNCYAEMARLTAAGVLIVDQPTAVPWGISGIFRDLYGNPYNLVGPAR
jgi:predicted enzyme related to lactoylglutathione lyase